MMCSSVLGIPSLTITVYSPMRMRPVVSISYELAAGHGLEGAAGLASMRGQFDDALDLLPPGAAGIGTPPLDGCRVDWTIGGRRFDQSDHLAEAPLMTPDLEQLRAMNRPRTVDDHGRDRRIRNTYNQPVYAPRDLAWVTTTLVGFDWAHLFTSPLLDSLFGPG
ncbi:MAG: hypothetical protein ABIR32_11305 [Ilumatobacteraceae bacterium]